MNILVSPNAFKGTLSARKAAAAIRAGLMKSELDCKCTVLPIADGGDGSLEVITEYLDAEIRQQQVKGPAGRTIRAKYGWNEQEKTAIIELAEASGIRLLKNRPLNPMKATTYGTGQLMKEALDLGAKKLYLTLGGSATIDGALGILDALGVVFLGQDQIVISNPLPSDMYLIRELDVSAVAPGLRDVEIHVLCDVNNPLLGETGARVFAPQKGATEAEVIRLEKGLTHLAGVIRRQFGVETGAVAHGGAAGGVAAGLYGILGATLTDGASQILQWAGFQDALKRADIVITAEGQIDEQTAYGKGPGVVARLSREAGKITIGLSGFVRANDLQFKNFDMVLPVTNASGELSIAFANTAKNLRRTAFQLGQLLHVLRKNPRWLETS